MIKSRIKLFLRKWTDQYKKNSLLRYSFIFLVCFLLLSYLQASPIIADPDAFYHAKIAMLIRDQGFVQNFSWLGSFTILGDVYTNQHVLYHVLLIPFISLTEPIVGLKLATVFFGAGFGVIFFWILRRNKVPIPEFFLLLLFTTSPFLFRINLGKATAISLGLLFLGIDCFLHKRYKALFVISAIYVWAYGGFLMLLVCAVIYTLVHFYWRVFKNLYKPWKISWKNIIKSDEFRIVGVILLGNAIGIVTHPYFPKNIEYYKSQLIDIGIINYQDTIGVGGEWYPYAVERLVTDGIWVFLGIFIITMLSLYKIRKQSVKTIAAFGFFLLLFLATMKSRRYVEYLIPMAVFSYSIIAAQLLPHKRRLSVLWSKYYRVNKYAAGVFATFVLTMFVFIGYSDVRETKKDLGRGNHYTKFQGAMEWLEQSSTKGDMVFHSDWDEFPLLFYYNTKTNYIVGLDPTFMYKYDEKLYWDWVHITKGEKSDDLYRTIKKDFDAQYIFLEKDHVRMDKNISNSIGFTLLYEDDEAKIYKVE